MLWSPAEVINRISDATMTLLVKLQCQLSLLRSDVRGSAALEYALMASGIALAGTGVATMVGGDAFHMLQDVQTSLCVQFKPLCFTR